MYNKKLLSSIDLGKYKKKNPYKKDIILDPMGQWNHPGKNTRIPSSSITMKGVNYPVLGVSNTGQKQMMQPGQEYNFPGADYVDEYPQMKKGGAKKKYTSDIINSTNYLFAEHPLFKKKKQSKKRIYDPNAKYYADGGENLQEECPPYQYWNGETCVPVNRELAPLDPEYLLEHPDVATNMQIEPEVSVSPLGSDFSKALSWINKWHDSPMHDKMLLKSSKLSTSTDSAGKKLFKEIKDKRKKNIQTIPALDIKLGKTDSNKKLIEDFYGFTPWAMSNNDTGNISVYDSFPGNKQMLIHEISHSSDRPYDELGRLIPDNDRLAMQYKTPMNWKNSQYGKNEMAKFKNSWTKLEDEYMGEEKIPRDIYEQNQFDDWRRYLLSGEGTEVRARLNEIRHGAQEQNIYDPFNKKITERKFKKLDKNLLYTQPLDDLRKTFSDKDIKWMLNNISKNDNETDDAIQYGKNGGQLSKAKYGHSIGNLIRKQNGGMLPKAQFGLTGMGKYPALTATPFDFRTAYGQTSDYNRNPNYSLTYTAPRLFKKADLAGNPLSFTLGRPYNTDAQSLTNRTLNFEPQEGLFNEYYDPAMQGGSNPQYQQYLQEVSNATGKDIADINQTTLNQYNAAKNLAGAKPLYKKGIPLTANIGWDAYGTAFGDSTSGPFTGYGSLNAGYAPEPGFYGTADFGMMGVFGKRKNNSSIKPKTYFDKGLTRQGDRAFIPKLNILNFAYRQRPEYNDLQTQKILDSYKQDIEQGTRTANDFIINKTDEKRFDVSFLSPEATFQIKPFKNIPGVASITGGLRLDYGGRETAGNSIPITPKPYGNVRYTVPIEGAIDKLKDLNLPSIKRKKTYNDYVNDQEYTEEYTDDTPQEETPTENNFEVNPPEVELNYDGQGVGKADCPKGYERPCPKCRCQKIKMPQMYTDKRGTHLFGNEPIEFYDGGAIELKLTPEEIEEYKRGGYIVEEINEYKEGGDKKKQGRNRWKNVTEKNPNPEPTKTPIDPRYLEQHPDTASYYLNQPEVALTPRGKNWITNTPGYAGVYINPDTGKLEQDKSKLATGSVEMKYPEKYVIGPGGGLVGAGIKGLEKISAASIPGLANIPGATIGNVLGAGFAADAIVNRLPEIPGQIQAGDYSGALINAGTAGLDILGANMGTGLIDEIGKGIAKRYDAVATGNSILPIAWKVEETSPLKSILQNKNYNLTDEEAEILNEYIYNPYKIKSSPEKSKIFTDIIQKNQVDLSGINQPISRYDNYYVSSYDREPLPTKYGSTFSFPRDRSWSIGIDNNANTRLTEKQRLVIPSRYATKLNENFHAVNYSDPRLPEALSRPHEKELIGNVPEGFKVIGNNKEGNIENIIIKPLKKDSPKTVSTLPILDKLKQFFDRPPGPLMIGLGQMSNFNKEIKNPDYYLDVMKLNKYSPKQKKYFEDLIESVKSQGNVATEKQYDELQRIKTGNMNYGKKGYKKGGVLLTKKVTCKKCGWTWDAADGGNDLTTCHKCGGQGLIHAQKGGYTNDISVPSLTRMQDGGDLIKIAKQLAKQATPGNNIRSLLYSGINPAAYGLKKKLLNLPKELYLTKINNETRPFRVGLTLQNPQNISKFLLNKNLANSEWDVLSDSEKMQLLGKKTTEKLTDKGKRRLDAWAVGLKQPQEYSTLEQVGDNTFRMKDISYDPEYFSELYTDILAKNIDRSGVYTDENPLVTIAKQHYDRSMHPYLRGLLGIKDQTQLGKDAIEKLSKMTRSQIDKALGYPHKEIEPWKQSRIVELSKINQDPKFKHSIYDLDQFGVMGGFRWDLASTPEGMLWQANDTWNLNPWESRGETTLDIDPFVKKLLDQHYRKPLENVEALGLVGGKPFDIQNNFLIQPGTFKTIKQYQPGGLIKTAKNLARTANIGTIGTLNTLAKNLAPVMVHPLKLATMFAGYDGLGPFTYSPLNILPFYGKDLSKPMDNTAFRKFGDTLDYVKNTGQMDPSHGPLLRIGKDQIKKEGNWAELGKPNESYSGVFGARFNTQVPGSNLGFQKIPNRNGVLVTDALGNRKPSIPLSEPGLSFHRRLPFSNRYIPVDMNKLRNDQFDWRTIGGNTQSLLERYGYAAGYAALLGAVGLSSPQEYLDEYINEPIMKGYNKYIKPSAEAAYDVLKPKRYRQTEYGTIEEYSKGGDVVEDISVPSLTRMQPGGLIKSLKPVIKGVTESVKNIDKVKQVSKIGKDISAIGKEILGEALQGSSNRKAIAAGNNWLDNWISNPITQAKIEADILSAPLNSDVSPNYFSAYSTPVYGDRAITDYDKYIYALDLAKDFKPGVTEYPISTQITDFIEGLSTGNAHAHLDNQGFSSMHQEDPFQRELYKSGYYKPNSTVIDRDYRPYRNYGSFVSRDPFISPYSRESISIHEGTHDWVTDWLLRKTGQFNLIQNQLDPDYLNLYNKWKNKDKTLTKLEKNKGYYADPTEVHARIMQLRRHNDLTPFDMVTDENSGYFMDQLLKNNVPFNGPQFAEMLGNDRNKLAKLMNDLYGIALPVGVATGAGALLANPYADESPVGKYQTGGFKVAKELLKEGNKIENLTSGLRSNIHKLNPLELKVGDFDIDKFNDMFRIPTQGTNSLTLPGSPNARTFISEIDWSKWNPETPNYPELINEYNAIEKLTKANGTWMKNPDGSPFVGSKLTKKEVIAHPKLSNDITNEEIAKMQFIQQQSSLFKKAFGNSKLVSPDGSPWILQHGSPKKFDTFDESKFQLGDSGYSGSGIYTVPPKGSADSYTISGRRFHTGDIEPTLYRLYGQGNNPITSAELIKLGANSPAGKEMDLFNFHRKSAPLNEQLLDYDVAIHNQSRGIERVRDLDDAWEVVFPTNKQLKSATGNVGFFDMTNPNIYKGLVPLAVGAGAGALMANPYQDQSPIGEYKNGGQYGLGDEVDEVTMKQLKKLGFTFEKIK